IPSSAGAPSTGGGTSGSISPPQGIFKGLGTFLGPLGAGLTAFTFESEKFFAILNTLASESRVNIVSNPHIMTSENKKAVINVSQSVPIITGQQTSTVSQPGIDPTTGGTSTTINTGGVNQTVEYKDAGVVLTVTPRIGERGTVALDVKQEVNAVGAPVPPTNSPSFTKREAETSVVLLNNQTLVLGGLIQDRVSNSDAGIPFLKNMPVFGWFFKSKDRQVQKIELLMLITPRVIGTALDAARITDEMRRVTPELNEAIRSAPRAPRSNMPPLDVPWEVAPISPVSVTPPASAPFPGAPPALPPPSGVPPVPGPSSGVPPIPSGPPPAGAPAPAAATPPPIVPPAPPVTPAPPGVAAPVPIITPPGVIPHPVTPPPGSAPAPALAPPPASVPAPAPIPGVAAPEQPGTARPTAPARPVPRIGPPVRPRPPIAPAPPGTAPPPQEETPAPAPTN
ncbi:MAG TPA: hypothetical protein VMQ51_15730, partial [Candidatus Binatia bacterium]|nr:hypothetical protein [Candidatus Binatia bacterium]